MKGRFDSVINESRPVIVDFHAVWCSPCKMQAPILKALAAEYGDKIKVVKNDVDQNNEVAGRYNIQNVPTLIIFKNGKQVWRQSGVVGKNQLNIVIKQNL